MMIEEYIIRTYVSSTENSEMKSASVETSPQGIIMLHCTIVINIALATNLRCGNKDEQRPPWLFV